MSLPRALILIALCWLPAHVQAQAPPAPVRYNVDYVSGDRVWRCKGRCRGVLVLESDRVVLTDRNRKQPTVIFTIPIAEVKAVNASTRREQVNQADTFLLGVPSQTNNREYVTITTESETSATALRFWVPLNSADNIVAKIEFAMKKAHPPAN